MSSTETEYARELAEWQPGQPLPSVPWGRFKLPEHVVSWYAASLMRRGYTCRVVEPSAPPRSGTYTRAPQRTGRYVLLVYRGRAHARWLTFGTAGELAALLQAGFIFADMERARARRKAR